MHLRLCDLPRDSHICLETLYFYIHCSDNSDFLHYNKTPFRTLLSALMSVATGVPVAIINVFKEECQSHSRFELLLVQHTKINWTNNAE